MERLVDPLTTTDAKLWADEFMKVKARLGEQKFDHAMMLGWFANAIMQGYDEGRRRAKADAQAKVEALQRERDEAWIRFACVGSHAEFLSDLDDLLTNHCLAMNALDAEREKVKDGETAYKKLSEQWNATDLELSQLQALVRAEDAAYEKILLSRERLERELRGYPPVDNEGIPMVWQEPIGWVKRTLDATTPAKFTKDELTKWWQAQCPQCGWNGLSRDCAGGEPIADTGDYNDPMCPMCAQTGRCVVVDEYVEPKGGDGE